MTKTLKVHATRDGHYGGVYRKPGDTFIVTDPDNAFTSVWMVPADAAEGEAFMKRHNQGTRASEDAVVAERLAVGGSDEAVRLLKAENDDLKRTLTELAARVQSMEPSSGKAAAKAPAKAPAPEPATENDEAEDEPPVAAAPRRRRRAS